MLKHSLLSARKQATLILWLSTWITFYAMLWILLVPNGNALRILSDRNQLKLCKLFSLLPDHQCWSILRVLCSDTSVAYFIQQFFRHPFFNRITTWTMVTSHNCTEIFLVFLTAREKDPFGRQCSVCVWGGGRLFGPVVRVPGYRSRGSGPIPGANRFSEE
jgi:hypothetical protein